MTLERNNLEVYSTEMLIKKMASAKFSYKDLLIFEIGFILLAPILISEFHVPRTILYVVDVLNAFLFLYTYSKKKQSGTKVLYSLIACIAIIGLLGTVANGESFLLYFWGLRNTLRYLIFMINCVSLLSEKDIRNIFVVLDRLLLFNLVLGIYQFVVLKKSGDFLGAMFGTLTGSNGYLIAYLCIVLTFCFARFLSDEISIFGVGYRVAAILMLSIFAELKIMFIFLLICIIAIFFTKKPSLKTIGIVVLVPLFLYAAIRILAVLNPQSFSYFQSIEMIQWYFENGYKADGGFTRSDAIPQVYKMFLSNSISKVLFGMGLGQCDYSSISMFSSSFYDTYGYLNYRFFFAPMTFLEMGSFGLLSYLLFMFVLVYYTWTTHINLYKWTKTMNMLILVIIFVISIYNFTLRSDPGYIWSLAIVTPIILKKGARNIHCIERRKI